MPRQLHYKPDELIDSIMPIFWAKGYHATTPKLLADQTGVSQSYLYNNWGKNQLFLESLRHYINVGTDPVTDLLFHDKEGMKVVQKVLYDMIHAFKFGAFPSSCMMINTVIELQENLHGLSELYDRFFVRLRGALEAAYERAHALGEIKAVERIPEYIELFIATIFTLNLLNKIQSKEEMVAYVDEQLALIH